jgi:preprotein translocase subunit SecG
MSLFVVALHVVLCLLLVGIILLQPGKGGDVGSAFGGGGSNTMFGPRGPAGLLARATTVVAVGFMITSITLSIQSSRTSRPIEDLGEEMVLLEQELEAPSEPEILPFEPGGLPEDLSVDPVELPTEPTEAPAPGVP